MDVMDFEDFTPASLTCFVMSYIVQKIICWEYRGDSYDDYYQTISHVKFVQID